MSRRLIFVLAGLVTIGTSYAGTLRKIWDFDAGAPVVYDLRFSPDGKHIVVEAGRSWEDEFILMLDVTDPKASMRRVEIDPKISEAYFSHHIAWSPSGQQLFLGHTRVRLGSGETCSLSETTETTGWPVFVGEDRLVSQMSRPVGANVPGHARQGHWFLKFFNSDCQSMSSWDLPIELSLFDASAERGLICVRQDDRTSVVDAFSKTVLQELTTLGRQVYSIFRPVLFAASGKAICGVVGPGLEVTASCFDVDTGKELATTRTFTYLGISAALHAQRLVLSDTGRKFDFIDFGWVPASLKKRIVWDFGTNKELVSWSPKSQKVPSPYRPPESQPYPYDISPNGEYIVEGGAGMVSLYRIEP